MKKCLFCQLARGDQPCFKIYEDKNYLAFLDIAPLVKGHTLVIPKKHYRWIWDIPNLGDFFKIVSQIAKHYQKITHDQFVGSEIWGNQIYHAHIHLLPQPYQLFKIRWPRGKLTQEEGNQLQKKLALKNTKS